MGKKKLKIGFKNQSFIKMLCSVFDYVIDFFIYLYFDGDGN